MDQKDKAIIPSQHTFTQQYSSPQYVSFPSSESILQSLVSLSPHNTSIEQIQKSKKTVHFFTPPLILPDITHKHIFKSIKKHMVSYFFFCPDCFSFDTINTKKQFCYCQSCAAIWELSPPSCHVPQKRYVSLIYEILQQWYAWQYNCLRVFIDNRAATNECILKMNNVSIQISPTIKHKDTNTHKKKFTKATLQLYYDTTVWSNHHSTNNILYHTFSKKNYVSKLALQNVLSIGYKNEIPLRTIHIHTKDTVITIHGTKANKILTCFFALHYLKNKYY